MDGRLTDLELRYMQLERTVVELSDVVAEQDRTLRALIRELQVLSQRQQAAIDGNAANPGPHDERPPHY